MTYYVRTININGGYEMKGVRNNNGFVVSAVLYPLLVLFLALIMGLLAMTDTRKR